MLEQFISATNEYGVPSCVCSDYGGENIQVWRFMEVQGESRSSYIAGSSLWRDIYTAVTYRFVNIFSVFEENGYLDEADLFCLHYAYIPQINRALSAIKSAWNCHPLSTEANYSPLMLFAINAIVDPACDMETIASDYGLDPDADSPESEGLSEVVVPDTSLPLSSASLQYLKSTVDHWHQMVMALTCISKLYSVHQLMEDDDIVD